MRQIPLMMLLLCLLTVAGCQAKPGAKTHFQLGVEYYDAGSHADAAHEFEMAFKEDAKNDKALFNEGLCHLKTEQFDRAAEVYDRYIALKPSSAYGHINAGFAHAGLGNDSEARRHFEQAVALDKTYAYPYCGFAQYLLAKNTREADAEALRLLETACDVERRNSTAHYLRGVTLERGGIGQPARQAFQAAVDNDGDNQPALVRLAWYERGEKKYNDALKHYIRAAVLDTSDMEAFQGAGACFREVGNQPKSFEALFKAKGIDKANVATDRELVLTTIDYLIAQTEYLLHDVDNPGLTPAQVEAMQAEVNRLRDVRAQWRKMLGN